MVSQVVAVLSRGTMANLSHDILFLLDTSMLTHDE